MAVQIQIRRGTAANWTSANPTLADGELGYETDTAKLKAGDGSTSWTSLGYVTGSGGGGGSGISNIVEDTTPQLGGDLDVNGQAIVSASNGDIAVTPNGTGKVVLDGLDWPTADGSNGQVLQTDGSGSLSFATPSGSGSSTLLGLNDTPSSFVTAGEVLAVNSATNAMEFVANVASGPVDCASQTDVNEGSITDVVALTTAQYGDIVGGVDPNTLYVITDGTTSIDDSDDVTITAAATNDFLIYTGSAWEDQTPAQAQAALGLGTLATQSTITDSYVGHIETIADGTYYIDVRVPAGRTLTSVYLDADSGASATVDLQEGGTTMLSGTASLTGGTPLEILTSATSPTISDTALAADAVLTLVISGSSSGDNLRFAVEFTQ